MQFYVFIPDISPGGGGGGGGGREHFHIGPYEMCPELGSPFSAGMSEPG